MEHSVKEKQDSNEVEKQGKQVDVKVNKATPQRLWTTILSAIIAGIPFLLVGCTLGFPSGALLDLTHLETRQEFKLTREQADLFGVSTIA